MIIIMSNIYALFNERYSVIHQPTYELVLASAVLGNIFASGVVAYYISKKYQVDIYPLEQNINHKKNIPDLERVFYEGEETLLKPEDVTVLKDSKTKRKSVITKIYIAHQDYFRSRSLPVATNKSAYYANKCH